VGPARAIELICSGKGINAAEALELGVIDAVSAGGSSLKASAVSQARTLSNKRQLLNTHVPTDPPGAVEEAARRVLKRQGPLPEVLSAIGSTLLAGVVPSGSALAFERSEFDRLRLGDEARALRHLFFANRAAGREAIGSASDVSVAGVVGAGTMGTGIARALLDVGVQVVLVEINEEVLERAQERLHAGYQREVARGHITKTEADSRLQNLSTSTFYERLATTQLIIEAVHEDMTSKKNVLRTVMDIAGSDAVVATNTSYLDVNEIASATADPTRVVGMHFFSPAHATKVVEVVRTASSSHAAVATAVAMARRMRKTPVISGVGFGFIGNRIFNAYRLQCELMLEEGAYPAQIDNALENFGFSMGPFRVADMSGLDIAWRMRKIRAARRDPAVRYPEIADKLCQLGRFGQKTGLGWYRYDHGSTAPNVDCSVHDIIDAESARIGIARRRFTDTQIVRRGLLAMANEAAQTLDDGIASRASDIDVMMTSGYGFPRRCGGPTFWARLQDPQRLRAELDDLDKLTRRAP
jgi:3-hydroxyacyl-CoA dehydrogenase